MSLLSPIDNYCERLDASLLAEPLNALSNAAFFIAAYLLWRQYKRQIKTDLEVRLLIVLVAIIGAGSLAFHSFANNLAMLADVIPITCFIFCYLWVGIRRLFSFSSPLAASILVVFLGLSMLLAYIPKEYSFNGSISYFPALFAVLCFALGTQKRGFSKRYFTAFFLFSVSLIFRSIDMQLCLAIPFGTHFLWHMLNGALLYLLTHIILSTPKNERI